MPIFLEFLAKDYAEAPLQLWVDAQGVSKLPSSQQEEAAKATFQKYYGNTDTLEISAMSMLEKKADEAVKINDGHPQCLLLTELVRKRRITLLGHIIRCCDSDPVKQVTFENMNDLIIWDFIHKHLITSLCV